jgi:3-deoxy-D-manno-octulosonic-acid transferase
MYLPLDTTRNARYMLRLLDLEMAVFIKYEFWYHFLKSLHRQQVPLFLAAGFFRPGQLFFKDYGSWYRRFLRFFTHIFVQQPSSASLLETIGITRVTVAGDTRFDRVSQITSSEYHHPALGTFVRGRNVVVAGSTWERDEELLRHAFQELPKETGWIIAPHEISEEHLERLGRWFPGAVRFTRLEQEVPDDSRVVLIDTIGQLSFLYRFGRVAYIGGGFGRGIHNILEAATYGMPVLFGPNYSKFAEAVELVEEGGAFPVKDQETVVATLRSFFTDPGLLDERSVIASRFVSQRLGATERIVNHISRMPREQV